MMLCYHTSVGLVKAAKLQMRVRFVRIVIIFFGVLVPTRLSLTKSRLNTGAYCINYTGKILLFFPKCATVRLICASVEIPGDKDIMNPNLDFGGHIPDSWCQVHKGAP